MIEMKVMGLPLIQELVRLLLYYMIKKIERLCLFGLDLQKQVQLIRKIENLTVARPMTHDLIINIIEKTGYNLDKVEINDVEKDTYYATLFLSNENGETLEIDSRPSDAIAVAIRVMLRFLLQQMLFQTVLFLLILLKMKKKLKNLKSLFKVLNLQILQNL